MNRFLSKIVDLLVKYPFPSAVLYLLLVILVTLLGLSLSGCANSNTMGFN